MISEDKMRHILGVARRCEEIARERGLSAKIQNEMFLLGYLHDIGYEKGNGETHNELGYFLMKNAGGIAFATEIKLHGYPSNHILRVVNGDVYKSEALDILNQADIETMPNGVRCTAMERINELKQRGFDESTDKYRNLKTLATELGLLG